MYFRAIILFLCAVLLTACSSVDVHTDFNPAANFASYHTYIWMKQPKTSNPLMTARIISELDVAFAAKGWKRVESKDAADAALFVHATTREQPRINTYNTGGGWGWGRYGGMGMGMGGMSTSTVTFDTIGTLVVDIFDQHTQAAVWHASAQGAVTEDAEQDQEELREAVREMFIKFPPDSTVQH